MTVFDLPTWLLSLILAPFGLILGSFGNVLIHRLPLEEEADRNVVTKPSHCPACGTPIRWFHNVPLLSWLWLRGKCAACGWRIPLRYPLVECLTGALLAGSVWVLPFGTLIWLKGVLCGYALIVLFFTDLTEFILPDAIQFPLMALGVLFTLPQLFWPERSTRIATFGWDTLVVDTFLNGLQPAPAWTLQGPVVEWQASLLGLALGYGVPALFNQVYKWIRKTDGLGMGDFKMLAWLGAFWGWGPMAGILFGGALLGSAVGLPLLLLRKASGQTMLPFGCALALATPVVVFYGPALWAAYMGLMR
jgi:prepilin signal peptidase PulO-like enzyme (type II secretory pathway)